MAASTSFLVILFLPHLTLLYSSQEENARQQDCQPFLCNDLGIISFPFFPTGVSECGGLCEVDCSTKTIKLGNESKWYDVVDISQANTVTINDRVLDQKLQHPNCGAFNNLSLPNSPSISFSIMQNKTFLKCNSSSQEISDEHFREHYHSYTECPGYTLFYPNESFLETYNIPHGCSVVQLPVKQHSEILDFSNPFQLLTSHYQLSFLVSADCINCHIRGGNCATSKWVDQWDEFECIHLKQDLTDGNKSKVIQATVVAGGFVIIICIIGFIISRPNKWNYLLYFFLKNVSSDLTSSAQDPEGGTFYFGLPVFSYSVLEEATNNFDPSKKLGHGGFGTVYHGILRDRREVAVKRLYDNNCNRVEQFINEIEILTRLRHRNLVQLYGCTSRRSTELLLVYEYVPNGTVADHLHGDRATTGLLTWPIRMNIAIEAASALSYLHASDIIHRDVKTSNILLDNNLCVKVADFGISRLFPFGVTHVSTAPQGTPGYVDPQYHQCYRLTDKSDVYNFGVVLIELVSSMLAVDMSRHTDEINLANIAINRIQRSEFNELIDPCLGYETDSVVEKMTNSVAELAFLCLQVDKEMRPTMEEVFERLKYIRDYEYKVDRSVGPPPLP